MDLLDFMGLTDKKVDMAKQQFIKEGFSEEKATELAKIYTSQGQLRQPKTDIKGKIEGERFLVIFSFDSKNDADSVRNYFKVKGKISELDGNKLLEIIQKDMQVRWKKYEKEAGKVEL